MEAQDLPEARTLRWPLLVALDEMGVEDSIPDLQDRVVRRLNLSADAVQVSNPETGRLILTEHFAQALADLHASGAIDADETGRLWITGVGRVMTESDVVELPESAEEREESTVPPKPT